MKKIIAALVFVCILTACASSPDFPEKTWFGDFAYESLDSKRIVIVGYKGKEREVVIPDKINGKNIVGIDHNAFENNQLTSVTIPNSVTEIRANAFANNQLTSVTIPNGVNYIGENAFRDNQLTSVTIPNSVTKIKEGAFQNNKLTSVTIPIRVTEIGARAFANNQLTSVTIPDRVTTIADWAFYNNQLTSVTIPNSVTEIGASAFANNQLTSVTIPNSVRTIEYSTFFNNQLTSVTIPNSVTKIRASAFQNNKLTRVFIPEGVTEIGARAFTNNQLASVTIPIRVTNIGEGAFANNPLIIFLVYSDNNAYTVKDFFLLSKGEKRLLLYYGSESKITIPEGVTSIDSFAFYNKQLTSVTIPNSVTEIGEGAFANNQLTSVTIPESVKSIGGSAFANNQMTSITLLGVLLGDNNINTVFGEPLYDLKLGDKERIMLDNGTYELKNNQWYCNGTALSKPAKIIPGDGIYFKSIDGLSSFHRSVDAIYLSPGFHKIEVGYYRSDGYTSTSSKGTVTFEYAFVLESYTYDFTGKIEGDQILFSYKRRQ